MSWYDPRAVSARIQELAQQIGKKTVRELTTGAANIALPTMIVAEAILQMQTMVQLDKYCRIVNVPPGAGKAPKVQVVTAQQYDSWTEGSALSAADPTLASVTLTLADFGKVTQITDLLADSSAIDFAEVVGQSHGQAVQTGVNDKVVDAAAAATDNAQSVGTKADGKEADLTYAAISAARSAVLSDRWAGDVFVTTPKKWYTFAAANLTNVQFTGAMIDFLRTGVIPQFLGMEVVLDPYFEEAIKGAGKSYDGTDGEVYALVLSKGYSVVFGKQHDVESEIWREGRELSNYVVTHISAAAALAVDKSVAVIKHAA